MLVKYGVLNAIQLAFSKYFENEISIHFDIPIALGDNEVDVNAKINWASLGDVDVKKAYHFYCSLGKAIWAVSDINNMGICESQIENLSKDEYWNLTKLCLDTLTKSDGLQIIPPLEKWKYGQINEY